ncbi:hypothetical protein ACWEQN_46135 [Streptomyces sp. NPDC004129]
MLQPPDESLHWQPGFPVDAIRTLAALRRGHHDPTHRVTPDRALWRTDGVPPSGVAAISA